MSGDLLTRPDVASPATRRSRRDRFRGDIEGLRAVAVVLVVAFHAGVGFVGGGFVGVDVFFVLSGFLITGLLVDEVARTGSISLLDFYARRVRRLLPLASLVLVATALATAVLVPPIDRRDVAGDLVSAALWGANWTFAAESTQYMADTDKSPVLHYWSLAVEEQFYVVWPLLLLLLVGGSGLALRSWSVAFRRISLALGVIIAASLFVSWRQTGDGTPFAYFGVHTRAWELGIGAALALLRPVLRRMTRRAAQLAAGLGVTMVVGSAVVMDERTPFPGTAALVPVLGTALLVAAGARLPDGVVSRTLAARWPRYVGRVSYGWYLWHWPVLVLAAARWGEATTGPDGGDAPARLPASGVVAAVVLSFGLAVASHHLVEQPLRHARSLRGSRRRSLVAGGVLVATSLVASLGLALSPVVAGDSGTVVAPAAGPAAAPTPGGGSPAPGGTPATEPADPADAAPQRDPVQVREPNTPEEAREDSPDVSPCYVGYRPTTVAPAEQCRVGPTEGATRTIALVGDSHATAWYPAFRRAAEERGWTLYFFGKSACPVVDVEVLRAGSSTSYGECSRWRENLLDRLDGIPGLDAVVLARWKAYTTSTLQPDGSPSTPSTVGEVWADGAQRTFDRLHRAAGRVVVMQDVPWPLADVPSCLSEHRRDVEACAFSRSQRSGLDAALVAAEREAAPRAVRFADMTDVICPERTCQVVSPTGQIMYRDEHHLTAGYSATLWSPVADRLEAALR